VLEAAQRLAPAVNRTPVLTSRTLDERAGATIFLKCENFQRAGSFKFRGAYNAISRLSEERRRQGVLTYSSGNHAQALALAGKLLGAPVTVVMPTTAPRVKHEATASYGAEIILYEPAEESREALAREILAEREMTLIPPFDHPDIVSGQGTAAFELLDEVGPLDLLLVPCGGGGLLSGSALACTLVSGIRVVGVEPALADDAVRTFRTGVLQRVHNPPTIADGLRTPSLGELTWPIIREHVADMVAVAEADIIEAMRFLWTRMKIVVEPSGAVALAGFLADPTVARGGRVGVILSGGNVDMRAACELLAGSGATP
jgi:threonine dehydratase